VYGGAQVCGGPRTARSGARCAAAGCAAGCAPLSHAAASAPPQMPSTPLVPAAEGGRGGCVPPYCPGLIKRVAVRSQAAALRDHRGTAAGSYCRMGQSVTVTFQVLQHCLIRACCRGCGASTCVRGGKCNMLIEPVLKRLNMKMSDSHRPFQGWRSAQGGAHPWMGLCAWKVPCGGRAYAGAAGGGDAGQLGGLE